MKIHFVVLTAVSAASKSFAPVYPALLDYPNIFTDIKKNCLREVLDSSRNMALGNTDRTMPCRPGFHTASVQNSVCTFGQP